MNVFYDNVTVGIVVRNNAKATESSVFLLCYDQNVNNNSEVNQGQENTENNEMRKASQVN